eukprot:TRINITY_DN7933_c0_g1_i1.p1 TRINITY_DN7933_c0_g1~~TRINITY_DN7933_c0_g1_i1.p1  ORF type:complete len:208 (-),score=59.09 TRINITY_DN7933_c0_g1_i1:77-664(-)
MDGLNRTDYEAIRREAEEKLEAERPPLLKSPPLKVVHHLDEDTKTRALRGSRKMSEYLHHLANEPSIGLYHVCDHIIRNVPRSVETKKILKTSNKSVEDLNYDMDFTIRTVRNLHDLDTFTNLKQLITESTKTLENIRLKIPPSTPEPAPILSPTPIEPEATKETSEDSFGSEPDLNNCKFTYLDKFKLKHTLLN